MFPSPYLLVHYLVHWLVGIILLLLLNGWSRAGTQLESMRCRWRATIPIFNEWTSGEYRPSLRPYRSTYTALMKPTRSWRITHERCDNRGVLRVADNAATPTQSVTKKKKQITYASLPRSRRKEDCPGSSSTTSTPVRRLHFDAEQFHALLIVRCNGMGFTVEQSVVDDTISLFNDPTYAVYGERIEKNARLRTALVDWVIFAVVQAGRSGVLRSDIESALRWLQNGEGLYPTHLGLLSRTF